MSYEEKRTWVYLVASAGAYAVYLAIVVGRAAHAPFVDVPYIAALLWTTVASTVLSTVGRTVIDSRTPRASRRSDVRDKEIYRFGEYASRWCLAAAAASAMLMAMAKWNYFWIANVIYLGFVLWAVVGSVVKLVAYRRGM
jgi:hypothetical protein